ncbi:uncharacterized protein ASPGLDRAFT_988325 [Aspergillus glaucus CBS 516.65]|uniref:Uncharacterized protein n=1 Tax=Aspergillus glaucus CBS 516.65 TaxID=1160497 RepID=A0A1L9VUX8_ASPGL|nr:hypothetical protein ASPGLDRAFT_988325 [Aspergillus glaucus CBS 516.65]OJJ87731.1 hypothetical protein ASPGLDRAFT_988325 [Aspergillus glaucus CBS 516.65]
MVMYTGGESTAINSPRHLPLRHAIRKKEQHSSTKESLNTHGSKSTHLNPGEEELHSFWAPSLPAGPPYQVQVDQTVKSPEEQQPLQLKGNKEFVVEAPRFTLPTGSIYSVYPPSGYSEDHRILPHVVLSDPFLPWERQGSSRPPASPVTRCRVPWLALMVFTQDELRLSPGEVVSDGGDLSRKQSKSTLATRLSLNEVWSLNEKVALPYREEDLIGENTTADFIFLPKNLFSNIFPVGTESDRQRHDVSSYQYLSHVRKVNTAGMAVAGQEDTGIFSIIVSPRCGPIEPLQPTTVSVHLRVALCSLHSWNYSIQPPGTRNIQDSFQYLGENLGVLGPPPRILNSLQASDDLTNRLAKRLQDGYSLVRYRTQTGETTVAFFRGPFTPTVVPRETQHDNTFDADFAHCSNSGQDLQILDPEVGIMDITYSVAWQVGRMLALGDQAFTMALMRIRSSIYSETMKECKSLALKEDKNTHVVTRSELLGALRHIPGQLDQITTEKEDIDRSNRWFRRHWRAGVALTYTARGIRKRYLDVAVKVAKKLAKSTDGQIYNETNKPLSVDWMILLSWVMDRLFLHGVPAHYLITDPSHLEPERLKFFHIDSNWTDAMVDGALSLGNHRGEDRDRVAIKYALNEYISTAQPRLSYTPQIPTYGFYLRSDVVSRFPDLKVTTLPETTERAPLLRHEIVSDGVMLGLFDRVPGSRDLSELVFSQPPHQQCFVASSSLSRDELTVRIRRQYTVDWDERQKDPAKEASIDPSLMHPDDSNPIFAWGTKQGANDLRIIRASRYADFQLKTLHKEMGKFTRGGVETKFFNDDTATSALLALQLSDPIYQFHICLDNVFPNNGDAYDTGLRTLQRTVPPQVSPASMPSITDPEPELESKPTKYARRQPSPSPETTSTAVPSTAIADPETTPAVLASTSQSYKTYQVPRPVSAVVPASHPQYKCNITSVNSDTINVTKENLPQDLIFSIQVSNNYIPDYKIQAFDIWIPLGEADSHSPKLLQTYQGLRPTMLSNLRFNVIHKFPMLDGIPHLQLTAMPRSMKRVVPANMVSEMSFVLGLAQVNRFSFPETRFQVRTQVRYRLDRMPTFDGHIDVVVKNI